MKRWAWKAVKSRINGRSKPLCDNSLRVTLVWPGREKLSLISGKGHEKRLGQGKNHSNVVNEVPLKTKAIYFSKRAAETFFLETHCFDRLCNC